MLQRQERSLSTQSWRTRGYVAFWHIAKLFCSAKLGRNRANADFASSPAANRL